MVGTIGGTEAGQNAAMSVMLFGQWLKERRDTLGLTQDELAQRIGCSPETIRKFEAGTRRPSRQIAELLADSFHIAPDELETFLKFARNQSRAIEDEETGSSTEPLVVTDSPWRALERRRTNLPAQTTRFIGREREVGEVGALLLRDTVRLLTLTGSPGIGKTRLSIEVASEALAHFENGAFFVALAPVSDPSLVAATIAGTLGVKETGKKPLLDTLTQFLRDKRILLVLDNFEQVVEAGPVVAEILAGCPSLKVMCTSREALRLQGERQYPVPPLPLPHSGHVHNLKEVLEYPAVALFVESAQAVKPEFALTEENAPVIAEICARLDGLPLAIELAAARVKMFTPRAMLDRLGQMSLAKLELLTGGARDLPARHQTLRNAIAWSYDLLSEGEQMLFKRLGVFVGGCALSAVQAVCNARGDLPVSVLTGIESLLDKSLLRQDWIQDHEPRFIMLETILEYARERLEESSEADEVRRLHAEYYLALAEATNPQLAGTEQKLWSDRLEREHDNLRAALQWSQLSSGGVEVGLRMLAALVLFWEMHSHFTEGREWVTRYLARAEAAKPTVHKAQALLGTGRLAVSQDDYRAARSHFEEALAIGRELADERITAYARGYLGWASMFLENNHAEAHALLMESLSFFQQSDDHWGRVEMRSLLAWLAERQNDYATAQLILEGTVALALEAGDKWHSQLALYLLGNALAGQGEYEKANTVYQQSLDVAQELGDKRATQVALNCLGRMALNQSDPDRAEALLQQSLTLAREMGITVNATISLLYLGLAALAQGEDIQAGELLTQCAAWAREEEDRTILPNVLNALAQVALARNEHQKAEVLLRNGLSLSQEVGRKRSIALQLLGLAAVAGAGSASHSGHLERAARLSGASDATLDAIHAHIEPKDRTVCDRYLSMARTGLDETAWDVAYQEGRAMTLLQAVGYALGEV